MDGETFYASSEVARQLGISDSTLRVWKNRYGDRLVENVHWVKNSDGSTLWSETGLTELKTFQGNGNRNGNVSPQHPDETEPLQDETEPLHDRYTQLIETVADALTPTLMKRLDNAVMGNMKRSLAQPMSASECVLVLADLGLQSADPKALLGGNVAGLLQGETPKE